MEAEGVTEAPVLEGEESLEAKSLGDEVELLGVVDVGDHCALEGVRVPRGCHSYRVSWSEGTNLRSPPAIPECVSLWEHDGVRHGVGAHDRVEDLIHTPTTITGCDRPMVVVDLSVEV